MELSHRRLAAALISLAALGAAAGAWTLFRRRAPVESPRPPAAVEREHVVVEVLNATGRRGLARVATRVLRQAGFDVVYFGTSGDSLRISEALGLRIGDMNFINLTLVVHGGKGGKDGIGFFGAYALTLLALRLAPAASVAAVRESSVVIAAAVLAASGRERVSAERLAGAVAVVAGIALISLG